jgi:hypothetical protein
MHGMGAASAREARIGCARPNSGLTRTQWVRVAPEFR